MSIFERIWNAIRPDRLSEDVRAEMETHFALLEEEERAHGLTREQARIQANRRFGNRMVYSERARDVDVVVWLDTLRQDLRFAWRQILQRPGFSLTAVSLLALGIGVNAAIFTIVNSVLLRSLPLPDADRLAVFLEKTPGGCCSPPSWLDQRDIREQNRVFESLAAFSFQSSFLFRLGDRSQRLNGGYVTPDYFSTLGVTPVAGRVFNASEAEAGHDRVVLLREDFWRSALDGDPGILQRTVVVNGESRNVIGILPGWFRFPNDNSVIWTPLVPPLTAAKDRGWHGFPLVGRLKPGVTLPQARADLDGVIRRLSREYPDSHRDRGGAVFGLREWKIGDGMRARLLTLQIAAAALFLMACANVSSLFLARYAARRREFAIRTALGASRPRQIRQHLTEALLLTTIGCGAAAGVSWAAVRFLLWLYGGRLPRAAEVSPDWRLVGITIAVALGGAIAIGLATALHENTRTLEAATHQSNRISASRRNVFARRALVMLQVACAVTLLGGAGELIQSVWTLLHVDVGIDRDQLVTMRVDLPQIKYNTGGDVARFFEKAAASLESLPGVTRAAAINLLPVQEAGMNGDVEVRGLPPHSSAFFAEYRWTTSNYFQTTHVPLLRGRLFLPEEMSGHDKAAIINETMARRLWGEKDPIGSPIRVAGAEEWMMVVGIVRDVRQAGVEIPARPEVFFPARTFPEAFPTWSMLIRSPLPVQALAPAARRTLQALDPDAVMYQVKTMENVIADSVSYQRIVAILLLCFSALALTVAALGVYGVVSYVVTERAPEIAIRAALGAGPSRVISLVAGQGTALIGAGLGLGSVALVPLNSVLANLLYGVNRLNGWTFACVLAVLGVSGAAALALPAWRAARIDPIRVLRQE